MSEKGVFVLETKGPEYRVSDIIPYQEVLNKLDNNSYKWDYNPEKIKLNFSNRPCYPDRDRAIQFASRIAHLKDDELEWGVLLVENWKHMTFGEMINDESKTEGAH